MLILFICSISAFLYVDDCNSYYKESLFEVNIFGTLEEKKENEKYYVIRIKEEDKDSITTIYLLKNNTGKEIFEFLIEGSYLKKKQKTLIISILSPNKDGGYDGRRFDNLCN